MPIKNYTTKVDALKTQMEISYILASHKAMAVLQEYDAKGRATALSFKVMTGNGPQSIRLQANVPAMQKVLKEQGQKHDSEIAERVAWRNIKDWIDAQMAFLETELVTIDQIILPFMIDRQGQTVYDRFLSNQLLLEEA